MDKVGNWVSVGIKALPLITAAVSAIEKFFNKESGGKKEDEAYQMFAHLLSLTEGITGKDLADDAKVEAATREVFRAVVAFQNVVRDIKAKQAAQ